MSISRKLVSNALFSFLDWFIAFIFSFLFWIIIWKNLSPQDSGIYSVAQDFIVLIAAIASLGLGSACSKLIPEYVVTKRYGTIYSLVRFSFEAILITSFISAIIIFLSVPILTTYIANFPANVVIFVSFGVIFSTFAGLFGSILSGFQNIKRIFTTDSVGNIVKFFLALILIYFGFQYIGPLIGFLVGLFATMILRLNVKWFKKTSVKIDKKFVLYEYSFPALLSSISSIIFSNIPYLILAFFSGLVASGIFTTALSLTSQLMVMISILSNAIFPVISQLSVFKHTRSKQGTIINIGIKYGLLITAPIALALTLAPRAIVLLLSQTKYLPAADLLPILSISFLIMGMGTIILSSLYAVKRPKTYRNIWLFSSVVFLFISIPLTVYYAAFGISIAYLISTSILFLLSLFYLRKYIEFVFEWKNVLKIFIASLIFVLFIFLADILSISVIFKYLIGAIGFVMYFFSLIFMKFFTEYDIRLLEILSERIPFLRKFFVLINKLISKTI
jgi:stage V sporulation protein B